MNRQRRQEAKKKRRERENRAERRRRFESDHCHALVWQADAMWRGAGDLAEARRLLEKAVRIRPGFQDAHERLAELDIRSRRFLEGLSHYEQLTRPPDWPQLTYMAAVAAYQLGRFDQAGTLARLFLQTARNYPELKAARADARQLRDSCKTLARQNRAPSHDTLPPSHRRPALDETPLRQGVQLPLSFERPSIATRSNAGWHAGDPSVGGNRPQRSRAPRAPEDPPPNPANRAHRPQPTASPEVDLPAFPALALPELRVDFEVDGQAFVSGIDKRIGSAVDVRLRRDYAALRLQKGFDELISIGSVRGLEHFWYQFETVRRLLRDFRGRVLLADEVGLGKTIEACLALKEYWMRGLVAKALILTPPSLVGQWADELTSKFGLAAAVAESGKVTPNDDFWDRQPIVVASLPLVRQQTYRARLITIDYDLVIVDEAHVLKKRTSAAWQLVNELKKRFLLLLSATPVGNDLSELYNLILRRTRSYLLSAVRHYRVGRSLSREPLRRSLAAAGLGAAQLGGPVN